MPDHDGSNPPPTPRAADHLPIRIVTPLFGRSPAPRRLASWYLHVIGMFAIAFLAVVLFLRNAPAPGAVLVGVAAILFVALFFRAGAIERRGRDEFFRLRDDKFRACPACAYDLRQSPEEGLCPECAAPYDPEYLELTWTYSYKSFVTIVTEDTFFRELRAANEAREARQKSYQNTNISVNPPSSR